MHPARALEGRHVRLEPLGVEHAAGLAAAVSEASLWPYIPWPPVRSEADARAYIEGALGAARDGSQAPFAIVGLAGDGGRGTVCGTTRYTDILAAHRQLEIGWTIVGPAWQRTAVNTEAKLLLLRHAFEAIAFPGGVGCVRVQLKCDARNERSQRAILRIGASFEGRLRRHRVMPDGYVRDTMMYSIVDSEWEGVRGRLEGMLGATA